MLSQEEVEDIEKVSSKSLSRSTDPSNIPQVYPPSALGYFELVVEACEKRGWKSSSFQSRMSPHHFHDLHSLSLFPSAPENLTLVTEACEKSNIEIDLNRECYIFSCIISFASFNTYILILS